MIVSSVYVYWPCTCRRSAASRENARNPLVASRTSVPDSTRTACVPRCCSAFLTGENVAIELSGRVPTTTSASPAEHRGDELGDVGTDVLVVGVGVDDHVGTGAQARLDPGHERPRQAPVDVVADDVVHAALPGDLHRAVACCRRR